MDMKARKNAISFLRELHDEDLASVFYEAMETRNEYRRHPDGTFWNDVYVIGIASHTESSPAEIEVLATAYDKDSPFLEDAKKSGANENGECPVCKTYLASTLKLAKCPVCGSAVGCT